MLPETSKAQDDDALVPRQAERRLRPGEGDDRQGRGPRPGARGGIRRGGAGRPADPAAVEPRPAAASRARRRRARARSRSDAERDEARRSSAAGQMKVTSVPPPRRRWPCARSPARGRRRCDSATASTPARPNAGRRSTSRCSAASAKRRRKARSEVSTTSCSPVSASWTSSGPTSGRSDSRGSWRRMAITSWRRLSSSSSRSQPGLADEVGDDEDERPSLHRPARRPQERGQVGHRRRRRGAGGRRGRG